MIDIFTTLATLVGADVVCIQAEWEALSPEQRRDRQREEFASWLIIGAWAPASKEKELS